jgi:two-component system alkaline phosphatase synthesis response regulator PhoP
MLRTNAENHATILLIDDSREFRNSLWQGLELEGYRVFEAGDGQKGLSLFREARPDLVLLDMIMPENDEIETLWDILEIDPGARGIVKDHGVSPPVGLACMAP